MDTFISLDCEANGLHGQIFAAAAVLFADGRETQARTVRCPITDEPDPWVVEHVLPGIADIPITVPGFRDLLAWWWCTYQDWGGREVPVVCHIPWPVEARFLWGAHAQKPFSGPYPLIDVASMLHAQGHDLTTVDGYLKAAGIALPDGSPHHPLYDARAAALAYQHLVSSAEGDQ